MTDMDIIHAAADFGYSFEVALAAIELCSDDDERAHYAERGVRVLLECVSRAATHEQRFHA
jgi:hypothetical protein